jgi:hypothetical protein
MLDLNTFKIEMSSNKNGGLIININKEKIPFDHSVDMDYFYQAKKYIEAKGYNIIGYNHLSKIIVASLVKYNVRRVFKFSELSKKVQTKVIEKWQNESYDTLECTNDYIVEILNRLGFDDAALDYQCSFSQSDYFRFSGTFEKSDLSEMKIEYENCDDILEIIELIETLPDLKFKRHYTNIEILDDLDTQENLNAIKTALKAIDAWIKSMVIGEIDYQSLDSTIIENIECNGYEFYENGEIV